MPRTAPAGTRPPDDPCAAFIRKLTHFVPLGSGDREALFRMCDRVRMAEPHAALLAEGDSPEEALVVLSGFACRLRECRDGRRQILAYLTPGDICDPEVALLCGRLDFALVTLTPCRVAQVTRETLQRTIDAHPRVALALRLARLAEEATAREWLISLGCRSAIERLGHLFCEMLMRLQAIGDASNDCCDLPFTQAELADAMGLSTVHVNRTLQALRSQGLIALKGRRLHVKSVPGLWALADFSPLYLSPQAPEPGGTSDDPETTRHRAWAGACPGGGGPRSSATR